MNSTRRRSTKVTRRTFIKKTATSVLLSTVAISGCKSHGRIIGANDRIRVGVAGIHGQGKKHIHEFSQMKNVEVVTLIDPDSSLFESRRAMVQEKWGNTPTCVQDVRVALDDKNLDALSIATCNHWHSLMTIWACQAGKDVYVEKPMSHNIYEGRMAVEAARKYNRIVQHGTQQRGDGLRVKEIAAVQSGKYGKLLVSKGYCCKPRWSIGYQKTERPPAKLDFDIWLGPAPQQPFHRNLVHYNWHWFWDTGNSDIGNQGVHEMDVARWAIRGATLPKQVWSLGGRFGYEDQGQTPNTQMAVFEYDDALLVFEVRGLVEKETGESLKVQNEYYTDEGMITRGQFHPKNGGKPEPIEAVSGTANGSGIFTNFIEAMRSRRAGALKADILEGHYSSSLCHLANISYRLGKQVPFNRKTGALGDNRVILDTYRALENNLARANGLRLESKTYQLGRTLKFDPKTERFVDDREADRLLSRQYRKPFEVPDKLS